MKLKFALLILLILAMAVPGAARADGIIIPEPPICDPGPCPPLPMDQLVIRYHHVSVKIDNQVAVTHVDQVFYNPNDWEIEGWYMFPIPLDAAVTGFTLWIDGEPVEGKVLDAQQARQTYEEIVRGMRDPALLEYADRGAVQARIYPIPPKGERRVELEYSQVLTAENGLVRYIYPLSTEKFSALPLEEVSISVDIQSSSPIRAVYSPSHEVDIVREDEGHVKAGYEAYDVLPDADFALYYSLGEAEAFHLLSYRDPSDPQDVDGFFLVLLAPSIKTTGRVMPKDLILVLDRSGSMEGEKFSQAQAALRYILDHLNPGDRFNIIAFSTGIDAYASGLRSEEEAGEARAWVDTLGAQGSTDINRALLEAASMADAERPTYVIFLTDGLPTEGEVESQKILDNFTRAAPEELRLFVFGVGYDVDTFLLDSLAQAHHGTSTYVLPGEALDELLSAFYARISTPVLTELELDFGTISTYDLYPSPLPDLFSGSQIVAVGRYRKGGTSDVTLTGMFEGEQKQFTFTGQSFANDSLDGNSILPSLPRLWATRKIGYLLNQVRLNGPDQETIDQIVRLSIRYGIVTPYTSYLVTEGKVLGEEAQDRVAGEALKQMQSTEAPSVGQEAVEAAAGQNALQDAGSAYAPSLEVLNQVRIVGARTYVLNGGVWTDTAFDPEKMTPTKVAFLSDDYFRLAGAYPELGAAFALGEKVIAFADGKVYEVVGAESPVEPVDIPPTQAPVLVEPAEEPTMTIEVIKPKPQAPGNVPCGSGLLPLVLLIGWWATNIWRRR